MRILIIEDQVISLALLSSLLAQAGHQPIEARFGAEGIRMARVNYPDLILMDIGLPDMSGLSAATVLKADSTTSHIPIIAVNISASQQDRIRASEAGCDGFIPKPFNLLDLLTAIEAFAPRPKGPRL